MRINQGLNLLQGKEISKNHQGNPSHLDIRPYSLVIVIYTPFFVIKIDIVDHTARIIIKFIIKTIKVILYIDKKKYLMAMTT